jgi:hypothetical protein
MSRGRIAAPFLSCACRSTTHAARCVACQGVRCHAMLGIRDLPSRVAGGSHLLRSRSHDAKDGEADFTCTIGGSYERR